MLLPSDWKASGLDPSFMNFISTTGRVNPPGALLPPFPPSQAYPPMAYLLRQPPRASRSLKPIVLLPPLVLPPDPPAYPPYASLLRPVRLDQDPKKSGEGGAHRGMRDMNETWLVEAGLNSAPREMFNLRKIKSSDSVGSGSAAPSTASVTPTMEVAAFMAEKHPDTTCGAVGSTTKAPTEKGKELGGKGKELVEVEEVPERGYSIRDLCEVENRVGANGNFASIMMRLRPGEGEELLMPRWLSIPVSARVWIEGSLAAEYLWGALHPVLAKQLYEYKERLGWLYSRPKQGETLADLLGKGRRRLLSPNG
ncbi:hypothetical protein B296_00004091 [Ensete ventricosum]|uniref:Uncharacterized protein n=1 Tax=Ensete ventricosum TaxID=4639 RepID=A0A426ZYI0_ENSVE|nr:hypothetical protein B296_00004091 [Ensete ventricosum]